MSKRLKVSVSYRQSPATTDAQVDVKWRLICDFLEGLQAKGVHSYQSKVDEFWNRFGQEELYNAVSEVCAAGRVEDLRKKLSDFQHRYLTGEISKINLESSDAQMTIAMATKIWDEYLSQLRLVNVIFLHLDKHNPALEHDSAGSLWSIGVELFAKVLLSRPYTLEVITKSYAELVRGLITASYSGLELLSNCLGMAISTKLYDHYFQPAILSTLSNHFKSLGGLFCASSASIQTLLETVYIESNRLQQLKSKALTTQTQVTVQNYIDESVFLANEGVILSAGLKALLHGYFNDYFRASASGVGASLNPHGSSKEIIEPTLSATSNSSPNSSHLLLPLKILQAVKDHYVRVGSYLNFRHSIRNTLRDIVTSLISGGIESVPITEISYFLPSTQRRHGSREELREILDKKLVSDLIELHDAIVKLISNVFRGEADNIMTDFRGVLETAIIAREEKVSYLLAKYCIAPFRRPKQGSTVGFTKEDLFAHVSKIVVFLSSIHNIDTFELQYRKDLAKRLLSGSTMSLVLEEEMLNIFRRHYGANFTRMLDNMVSDIYSSNKLSGQYSLDPATKDIVKISSLDEAVAKINELPDADFQLMDGVSSGTFVPTETHFHVLSDYYWPTYPSVAMKLPLEFLLPLKSFVQYYHAIQPQKRHLKWAPTAGNCIVHAKFLSGRKELDTSLPQALVLLLYNKHRSLSYKQIQSITAMESKELTMTLQSLSLGRVKLLIKSTEGIVVTDDTEFSINDSFAHASTYILLGRVQTPEVVENREKSEILGSEDQKYVIEAAVVAALKKHKVLIHNELMQHVLSKVKFPTTNVFIKTVVEDLIARDFIERDSNASDKYHYVL